MKEEYIIDGNRFIIDNGTLTKVIPSPNTTIIDKFPVGIESIGEAAFYGCTSLEKIKLPDGVKSIGNSSFSGCIKLMKINIPKGVTSIGNKAFQSCFKLQEIEIPEGVTSIAESTFFRCSSLRKIDIPKGVTSIGKNAFDGCTYLSEIKIPNEVTSISENAFYRCTSLKKIDIPKGITSIGKNTFYGCSSLTEIEIPEGVKSIEEYSFDGCYNLKNVKILGTINSIGKCAFRNCSNIPEIIIPNGIMSIDKHAFSVFTNILFNSFIFKNDSLVKDNEYSKFVSEYIDKKKNTDIDIMAIIKLGIKHNEDNYKLFENLDRNKLDYLVENYNGFFLKYEDSISDIIYDNFKYLASQKNLIDIDVLKKIYFGFDFEFDFENETQNKKDFYNKLKEEMHNIDIDLLSTLFTEDKLELRDRLVFVSTMKYLDDNSAYKDIDSAIKMLKRNTFANLTEIDQKQYNKHFDFTNKLIEDNEYFNCIKYHLTKELVSINPDLIRLFSNNYGAKTTQFLNSLNTINNWDSYEDSKQRATFLKNEIVARVLYAFERLKDENKKAENRKFIIEKDEEEKFWEYICKSDFNKLFRSTDVDDPSTIELTAEERIEKGKNIKYINKIIKTNPYTFDILRGENRIDTSFYQEAYNKGYLFNDKELKYINQNDPTANIDPAERIAHYILNDIGISKIPEENEKEYLDNVNVLIKEYFKDVSKDEKKLFSIFRSVDVYLRKNSVDILENQKNSKSKELQEKIFDYSNKEYNDEDRLCYCLYNFNRLAHAVEEINSKIIRIEAKKYKTDEVYQNQVIEDGIGGYNDLQKYGIPIETINSGIINSGAIDQLVKTQELYYKINGVLNGLYTNGLDDSKKRLKRFIQSDDFKPNTLLVSINISDIDKTTTKDELKMVIDKFNEDNKKEIRKNTRIIKNSVALFVQSNAPKDKNIEHANDADIYRIANDIFSIKKLSEKTRERIKIDAQEQRLFFKAKTLVAKEFMNTMSNYAKDKALKAKNKKTKEEFFKDKGYLIEFQKNNTGELLVCYNPKFQEPFSVHMKDLGLDERKEINKISRNDTITYSAVDGGLSETRLIECEENEILPSLDTGFIETKNYNENITKSIKKAIKVQNFLKYDVVAIKDMLDNYYESNPTPNKEEMDNLMKLINSKLPITNANSVRLIGYTKSVKELYEKALGENYKKLLKSLSKTTKTKSELTEMLETTEVIDEEGAKKL